MPAERSAFSASWKVGDRTATLTVPKTRKGQLRAAAIEWAPDRPGRLTADEWREYREGRNAALAQLALQIGGTVAVIGD